MAVQDVTELETHETIIWSTERLYLSLLGSFPKYVRDFQAKWNCWQQAISLEDFSAWSSGPSFRALTALGPKIIPLVVYQLALNPSDKAAVHLYTTLETDPSNLPSALSLGDVLNNSNKQGQQILRLALTRNRAARDALANWTERCERVARHASTSAAYTECAEYDALLSFGPGIVPHVMLQYKRDIDIGQRVGSGSVGVVGRGTQFWYELLHEIVWGGKTGLQTVVFGEVYALWEEWFLEGRWEVAPRFGGEAA